jgi:hypothetical protein
VQEVDPVGRDCRSRAVRSACCEAPTACRRPVFETRFDGDEDPNGFHSTVQRALLRPRGDRLNELVAQNLENRKTVRNCLRFQGDRGGGRADSEGPRPSGNGRSTRCHEGGSPRASANRKACPFRFTSQPPLFVCRTVWAAATPKRVAVSPTSRAGWLPIKAIAPGLEPYEAVASRSLT